MNEKLKANFLYYVARPERYKIITEGEGITITEEGRGVVYVGSERQKKVFQRLISESEAQEVIEKQKTRESKRKFARELEFLPGIEVELASRKMPGQIKMNVVNLMGENFERCLVKLSLDKDGVLREEQATFFTEDLIACGPTEA